MQLIRQSKSIIPSCDVDSIEKLKKLVRETCDVKGVSAYKIGFEIIIPFGMEKVAETIRKITNKPIIYDHQKAATDIPEMGSKFVTACKLADSVIFFPQAGPETEKAWILAAQKAKMHVIVGGEMTHPAYLREAGGFIENDAPKKIYEIAASLGIADFVVPGNKPGKVLIYKKIVESKIKNPVFYSPGLVTQGGDITGIAQKLERWHAIVGRAIYEAKDMKKAAEEMALKLA